MSPFFVIAFLVCLSVALLVVWPVLLHPTMPLQRRILLSVLIIFTLVPVALMLYAWLGVPQMAVG